MTQRTTRAYSQLKVEDTLILKSISGQQFSLATNIHQANLTEDGGWVVLELIGEDKDIEAGIAWAISKGVRAAPISDEI